ncbi:MAG: MarR family transcriptional regulator [Thermincolia bacterium]
MEIYRNLSHLTWNLLSSRKTKSNYISAQAENVQELSLTQHQAAKRAIEWLLAKSPHSVNEIANHFDISSQLVTYLVKEMEVTGRILEDEDNPGLYKVNDSYPARKRGVS